MTENRRLLACFRLLEVPPRASLDEVRASYRALSRVWHPDRFADGDDLVAKANARQQELNAAYRYLLEAYRTGVAPIGHAPEPEAVESAAQPGPPRPGPGAAAPAPVRWMPALPPLGTGAAVAVAGLLFVLVAWAWLTFAGGSLGPVPSGAAPATTSAVGAGHACSARNSTVTCWGRSEFGQVGGDGPAGRVWRANALPSAVRQVVAALAHSCALLDDGSVHCWGGNFGGQLGDGSVLDRSVSGPTRLDEPVEALSALGHHTCALSADGTLKCWGNDTDGQLGLGSPVASCRWDTLRFHCSDRPQRVRGPAWRMVAAGGSHTCAIDGGGELWCWGSNRSGQLGGPSSERCAGPDGAQPCSRAPVRVALGVPAVAVAAGASHTCALDREGRAFCWGQNRYGQAGREHLELVRLPELVSGGLRFGSIAAGGHHTCGVTMDEQVFCWGGNSYGELGGRAGRRCEGVPCSAVPVRSARVAAANVAAGFGATCAVSPHGRVSCWGRGEPAFAPAPRSPLATLSPGSGLRRALAEIRWRSARLKRFFERLLDPLIARV